MSTVTGTQCVREAIWARRSRLVSLSKDVGIRTELLDGFARGNVADLPRPVIDALVKEIWNDNLFLDPALDLLCPREQPPARSVGVLPTLDTSKLPRYKFGPNPNPGPQPEIAPKPRQRRAGWA